MQKQKKRLLFLAALKETNQRYQGPEKKTREKLQQLDNEEKKASFNNLTKCTSPLWVERCQPTMETGHWSSQSRWEVANASIQQLKKKEQGDDQQICSSVCLYIDSFINAEGRYKSLSEIFDVTEDKTLHPGGECAHAAAIRLPTWLQSAGHGWILVGPYPSFRVRTAWPVLSCV